MISVYDSYTRKKRPFTPLTPGQVSIYVCGVTPYAEAHLGHARPAVVWDVIRRHLLRRGYLVRYVQNFTDIDDKIVARAAETGLSVEALAKRYMSEYHDLMERLRILPPDYAPRVTENIPGIIDFITGLIHKGFAYEEAGDVYFSVARDLAYGGLSGRRTEELRQGVRVEVSETKRDPEDFALWKACGDDQPGWDSPWGRGRPGWHIECSTMSARYLGDRFDFHGGGIDLIFPHHENEAAQSRAYFGQDAAQCWVHNGLITQGQVKMSKSLGNGASLREVMDLVDPVVLRTYLLSVHYRSPLDFSRESLQEWAKGMDRVDRLWRAVKEAEAPSEWVQEPWVERLLGFEERFLEALDDDFNTARALAEVFDMVRDANYGVGQGYRHLAYGLARLNLMKADWVLGLLPRGQNGEEPASESLLATFAALRNEARQQKNYQLADQIRDVLGLAGYVFEDSSSGTSGIRRKS